MQNCIPLLDDAEQVFALMNRGLQRVPGVAGSRVRMTGDPARPGSCELPIETVSAQFGRLELELHDRDEFAIYEPFVRNLVGVVALWLENQSRQRRLAQALREREVFLAVVSHDLTNPLAAIVNVAQTLKEGGVPPEQVVRAAQLLERSANRMRRMIGDLLDLASIDAGRLSVVRVSEDVGRVAGEVVGELAAVARDKELTLVLEVAPGLPPVSCDGHRVAQALSNLIGNALKYTPPGGDVNVKVGRDGNDVEIAVSDNGPGIAPEDLAHVFERFYRSETTREPGTGLGLAISKAIAELHGGQLGVTSTLGAGSRFSLRLPLAPLGGDHATA